MNNYSKDFHDFNNQIWLNCASEGPLPKVAVEAVYEAVEWKKHPHELTFKRFAEVPLNLKKRLAELLNVSYEDIILGNSATYGIDLLANHFPFSAGDEILTMQNDFPTDILPWLCLEKDGVIVKQIKPKSYVISPQEILQNITLKTKLICLSHVHTFSGHMIDVVEIGKICRERNIIFVLNVSQSVGNLPVDLNELAVDAVVSAGFKWLLGPYGTGFVWIKKQWREKLRNNHAFWVNRMSVQELESEGALKLHDDHSTRSFDVFGTANFFNFYPWTKSIEYLNILGLENIFKNNQVLRQVFLENLDYDSYFLVSPQKEDNRSALLVFSHKNPRRNKEIFDSLKDDGIHLAFWKGNLRASPHVFNTSEDLTRLITSLSNLK